MHALLGPVPPGLFRIDLFLFSVEWEEHFEGFHQVTLLKMTSDHFPILPWDGEVSIGRHPLKFENTWLEVDGFCDLVRSYWDELNDTGPSSFIFAKKLNFLKTKLKQRNIDVFGRLEFKMASLVEKSEVLR